MGLTIGIAGSLLRDKGGPDDCKQGSPTVSDRLRHRLIGYARVSKADGSQSLDLPRYHDFAAGVRADRPGLESCLRALRTGDVLVV